MTQRLSINKAIFSQKKMKLAEVEKTVETSMKRLALEFSSGYPVYTLSGGTKRKLQVAIALLGNPSMLLLVRQMCFILEID